MSLASDIAFVIDRDGIVHHVVQRPAGQVVDSASEWVGRPWLETVTADTRTKIRLMLEELRTTGRARRREVNHEGDGDGQIPVAYTALQLGAQGPALAVGRDLRSVAAIQQQFLSAQHDLEMHYWRSKRNESRYRLLFEAATDGVLLVSADGLTITECNEAAARMFDVPIAEVLGRPATFAFDRISGLALSDLLTAAVESGLPSEVGVRLVSRMRRVRVAVAPLRMNAEDLLMMRVRAVDSDADGHQLNAATLRLVNESTDAIVVTDSAGRILVGNRAFLQLLVVSDDEAIREHPLADWVSIRGETWSSLRDEVRRRGVVRRLAASVIRQTAEVEERWLTATLLSDGDGEERIGFTLFRGPPRAPRRAQAVFSESPPDDFGPVFDGLFSRMGEEPLPALLRRFEAHAEHTLITRAVEQSNGDEARAARLLGVDTDRIKRVLARRKESNE